MKILLIDDSPTDRKIIMHLLERAKIVNEVLIAGDGQEGLLTLRARHQEICLVLLDWQMPNIDGLEFMRISRKDPILAPIPIIMVTSARAEDQKEIAMLINPNLAGYIVKPFNPELLLEKIRLYLK